MKSLNNITLFFLLITSTFYTQITVANPLLLAGKVFCQCVLFPVSASITSTGLEGIKSLLLNVTAKRTVLNTIKMGIHRSINVLWAASPTTLTTVGTIGAVGSIAGTHYFDGKLKANEEKKAKEKENQNNQKPSDGNKTDQPQLNSQQ